MFTPLKEYITEGLPDEFGDLPVLFYADWISYEECGWFVMFDFLGELMVLEGGYCVMAEDNDFVFVPSPYLAGNYDLFVQESIRECPDPELWQIEVDLL